VALDKSPALNGLRVLEISARDSFAASLMAMLLADQGAAVVKIGRSTAPPVPSEMRPARRGRWTSAYLVSLYDRPRALVAQYGDGPMSRGRDEARRCY
jgi:crotonobetainyl-CoA:carnitine CoA-transferase CaiB-like acyl-CoA transferase